MQASSEKGEVIILVVIAAMMAMSIIVIALFVKNFGTAKLPVQCIRFLLTAALGYFLYRGLNWAKWVTISLLGIAVIMGTISAVTQTSILMLTFSLVYFICVSVLLLSDSVSIFLESQQQVPNEISPEP